MSDVKYRDKGLKESEWCPEEGRLEILSRKEIITEKLSFEQNDLKQVRSKGSYPGMSILEPSDSKCRVGVSWRRQRNRKRSSLRTCALNFQMEDCK